MSSERSWKDSCTTLTKSAALGSNVPNSLFDLLAPTTSTESLTSQLVSSTESTSSVQSSTQSVATPVVESSTNLVQSIATSAPSFETSSTVDALATSAAVSPSATLSSSSDESSSTWQSKVAVESTSSIVYAVASDQATSTSYSSETTSSYSPVASSSSAAASSTSSFEYSSETFSPAPSTASIPISSAIELSTKSSTPVLISQQSSASPSQTVLTTPEAIAVSIISKSPFRSRSFQVSSFLPVSSSILSLSQILFRFSILFDGWRWPCVFAYAVTVNGTMAAQRDPVPTVVWPTKSKGKRWYREMRRQEFGQTGEGDGNSGAITETDIQTEVEDLGSTAANAVGETGVTANQDWGITSAAAAEVTSALVEVTSVSVGQQITSTAAEPTTAMIIATSAQADIQPITISQAGVQTSTLDEGVWSSSSDAVTLAAPSSFTTDNLALPATSAAAGEAGTSLALTAVNSQPGETILSDYGVAISATVDDSGVMSLSLEVASSSSFEPLVRTQSGGEISGVKETMSITTFTVETDAWKLSESLTVAEGVTSDVTATQFISESLPSSITSSAISYTSFQRLSEDLSSVSNGETNVALTSASGKFSSNTISNTLSDIIFSNSDTMSDTALLLISSSMTATDPEGTIAATLSTTILPTGSSLVDGPSESSDHSSAMGSSIDLNVTLTYNTYLSSQSRFSTSPELVTASPTVSMETGNDGLSGSMVVISPSSGLSPTTVLSSAGDLPTSATLPPTVSVMTTKDGLSILTTITVIESLPTSSLGAFTMSDGLSESSGLPAETYSLFWSSAMITTSNEVFISSGNVFATESNGITGSSWVEGGNLTTTFGGIPASESLSMTTETGNLSAMSEIISTFSSAFEGSTTDASIGDMLSSLTQYRQFVASSTSFPTSLASFLPSSFSSVYLSSSKTSVAQKTDMQGSFLGSESEVPTTSTQTAAIYVSESGTPSPSGNDVPLTTSEGKREGRRVHLTSCPACLRVSSCCF